MKHFEFIALALVKLLKELTFKQVALLALLAIILVPTYLALMVTNGIGPQFLLDIYQPVRPVGFVDDCPVLVANLSGRRLQIIYQGLYQHGPDRPASFSIVAYSYSPEWTEVDKDKLCHLLNNSVSTLKDKN
jgi:hypothetical protein